MRRIKLLTNVNGMPADTVVIVHAGLAEHLINSGAAIPFEENREENLSWLIRE